MRLWKRRSRQVRIGQMRTWLLLAFVFLAVPPVAAQGVLPARFAGWQAVSGSASRIALDQLPSSEATLLRNCHAQTGERQSYQKAGARIDVTLFRLRDPSWGYSAFSVLRPVAATHYRPAPHSSIGRKRGMLLVGNLLVDVTGKNLIADAKDFAVLASKLRRHASSQPYPTLWQYLPSEHFVPHTDRYAIDPHTLHRELAGTPAGAWGKGDWLGFYDSAEAEVAQYKVGRHRMTLLLASYPTWQLAATHLKHMGKWFDVNPAAGASKKGRVLYAKRIGSMVGLVEGARSASQADRLLGLIRYQTVVTWNQPGLELRNKLSQMTVPEFVVGIITGTGALILITLVVGIALGMIRVGIKKTFPGLIFDRRRSTEVIQLGLTTKPIDPTDFY